MNFIYRYVDLKIDICFGYIIFRLYYLHIIIRMLWILTSEGHFYYFLFGKPIYFQLYFLTIHCFCFIVINATVVHIVFSKSKWKK